MNDEQLHTVARLRAFLDGTVAVNFSVATQASAISDNDAAKRLNDARATLFKTIFDRSKTAA